MAENIKTSDARYRSYQYGGFVDTDAIRAKAASGLSDVNPNEGMEVGTRGLEDVDWKNLTQEEAEAVRKKGRDAATEHKSRRKWAKNTLGISDILGYKYDKGLLGKKGIPTRLVKGASKFVRSLGRGLRNIFKSDVHLKENIDFVGKSKDGINIYEWNYNNDKDNRYRGVLAHELKKDHSEAISKDKEGLAVDYSKIDVDFQKVEKYAKKSKK